MMKMQIGTAGLHFPDLRKKGLSCKSPWISVKHDAESVNRTKYDRLKTKNENCELSKTFPISCTIQNLYNSSFFLTYLALKWQDLA